MNSGDIVELLIFVSILAPVLITIGWMFDGEG
jgi:hypothetical protein